MIDSLETAIKHCEEVAEYMENKEGYAFTDITYAEYASEHRQFAEWLRELKDYRERIPSYEAGYNDAKREIALSREYERAYKRGYMKAMEYCTNKLKDVNKQTEVNADE